MNIDNLKLIIETLEKAGAGAKSLALVYLGIEALSPVLLFSFGVVFLILLAKLIRRIIDGCGFIRAIFGTVGIDPGSIIGYQDQNELLRVIKLHRDSYEKRTP